MHKYLRAIGFSEGKNRKEMHELILQAMREAQQKNYTSLDDKELLAEYFFYLAEGIGICVRGVFDENDVLHYEYYFPFLTSTIISSTKDISIERHAEKEPYAGVCDDMKVGVVLDGKTYKDAFDKEIILKILTEEGVFEVVSLAEKVKVNGERQTDGGKNKVNEILNSADKLIRYTINDDGNINNIVTASFDGSAEYKDEKIRSIYNGIEKQWYNSGRLGTTALTTKETPVFMIPYGDVNPDEEECAVLTYSSLTDNTLYYCNAYHYNTNSVAADAAVVYYEYGDLYDNIDMYRPVIMFSQTEQRLATDGSVEHILIGYTRGGRVEYIIPESISLAEIDEGDMIMLNHGINGNVVEGSKLFANDIEIVCKVNEISTNKKPTWTQNTHHDYLYANSETVINNYYRADFQMSFGYVCKVSGTHVAWSYNTGDNFSEAANITGNIVIYDSSRKDGDKIFIGKADDLVTYGVAGFDCSKIIFRTRGGRLWETFCYN